MSMCIRHTFSPNSPRPAPRGFTLLLAALISAIVLSLGAAIFQIARKEVTLSSLGRDSQFAFYVADTAAECALYWDFKFSYFSTTSPETVTPTCDGAPMNPSGLAAVYPYTVTTEQMDLFRDASPQGGYCAQVSVAKSLDPATQAIRTVIHADGYSTNCASVLTSPRSLQRSVELRY